MKCVPKINCDFEGVMRNQVFDLTPEMEMLRVPLIVRMDKIARMIITHTSLPSHVLTGMLAM